jgi:hypothetical protein
MSNSEWLINNGYEANLVSILNYHESQGGDDCACISDSAWDWINDHPISYGGDDYPDVIDSCIGEWPC